MTREPLPPETWEAVERRDRFCQAATYDFHSLRPCRGPLVVHHRRMRSHGVDHSLENLVLLCDRHHREVHDFPARAYDCGLLARTVADHPTTERNEP